MKVVQVPMSFYPTRGGAESYVGSLAYGLAKLGEEVLAAAPGRATERYLYAGLPVQRLAISPDQPAGLRQAYAAADADFAFRFGHLLDEERPDIIHIHTRTREISPLLMREAKRRKIRVLFTYHDPTISCLRGTLMVWGNQPCDGEIRLGRCTGCHLHKLGMPRPLANLLRD